jgi:hypothetical protein
MAKRRKGLTVDKTTAAGKWLQHQSRILAKKPRVKIGITQKNFGDPKQEESEETESQKFTVGEVAVVNEFGTADKRIPERSFIRSTSDEEKRRVNRMIAALKIPVIAGFMPADKALGLVGVFMKGKIQAKIVALRTPANAPSTIARKGSSNPLMDKGQMNEKIDWVVQNGPNR